jgi:lipoate-protein ligase A
MGISGVPSLLLDLHKVKNDNIPVFQRFSGGGTVIVDETTLFVTFILSKSALPILPFPEPILRWSADLYRSAWEIPGFDLRENDYIIHDRKCGGNAQYIQKERWLHHTSFLWDFRAENMEYLLLPQKRPQYRKDRPHGEFLCRMKDAGRNPDQMIESLRRELVKRFYIEDFSPGSLKTGPHRRAARQISIE